MQENSGCSHTAAQLGKRTAACGLQHGPYGAAVYLLRVESGAGDGAPSTAGVLLQIDSLPLQSALCMQGRKACGPPFVASGLACAASRPRCKAACAAADCARTPGIHKELRPPASFPNRLRCVQQ